MLTDTGPVQIADLETLLPGYVESITRAIVHGMGVCEELSPAPKPETRTIPSAASVGAALGASVENESAGSWSVRVKGQQFTENGTVVPLPDWLFSQAAEKGVTEVWDNRKDLATSTSNIPWFKQVVAKGEKSVGFWPPR